MHDVPVSAPSSSRPSPYTPGGPQSGRRDSSDGGNHAVSSPSARRHRSPTWRDPRLAIGVVIVAVSVLLGAKLLGDADDMVAVWAARDNLHAGGILTAQDLVRREVRFADTAAANRYVSADSSLPARATLTRDVGAGEMLPRAALGDAGDQTLVEVPVAAAADSIPATVDVGASVDVWITPKTAQGEPADGAIRVFDDVRVVGAPQRGSALGPSATRQIIIGVPQEKQDDVALFLAQSVTGQITVTKQR